MSTSVYDARGGMRNVWIITASMTVLAICLHNDNSFSAYISVGTRCS